MGHVETITNYSPATRADTISPVARHVALMRWRDNLAAYEHAEYCDISSLSEDEQGKAFDRAGEALDSLVETPAADLSVLAEKMRIMHRTGTVLATGYFEDLLADVDGLARRTIVVPTFKDVLTSIVAAAKRAFAKVEPWYNWYRANIFRLDAECPDFTDESTGDVWRVQFQWLGLHLGAEIGRTPPKLSPAEVAAARQRLSARRAVDGEA